MEEPRDELKANPNERGEKPDFDALTPPEDIVRGERTRDDFFDAVLALDRPTPADEIADLAGHGVDAAREYLKWFERMGIVTRVTKSPATYERNDEYLRWRRVQKLRKRYTSDELLGLLEDEAERDQSYVAEFEIESPERVSISQYAIETDRSLEDVWEDLSMWKTTRRRITLLEQALSGSDGSVDQRSTA
ncbi:DUF7342 family protein [Haloprofundus salilacus]|uniref:DUF7342 family protein n=1 Tax=Haloprofundus salilacus TaxID=2876190 RepID=UPI001CCB8E04|nr:hypothetical protein [Haloprofundus salilacus]